MEKLIKSVLSKSPESSYQQTSLNKLLKLLLKGVEKVITNPKFWQFMKAMSDPLPFASIGDNIGSVGPTSARLLSAQNGMDNQPQTVTRKSGMFAQGLEMKPLRQRRLPMSEFSTKLSANAENADALPTAIQEILLLTSDRREEPLYPSKVLGEPFVYSRKELEKKARRHLKDYRYKGLINKTSGQ